MAITVVVAHPGLINKYHTRPVPIFPVLHSADSSNELPDLHTTQTRASEVHASVVTEWPLVCLHKLILRGHKRATEETLKWKTFSNRSIFLLQVPFELKTYMDFFQDLVFVFQNDIFDLNKKNRYCYWGTTAKTRSILGITQTWVILK